MSKSKIKTREKGKDIKVLDKSAVAGQRMKSAFIRSKKNAEALMDDRQATPNEYAVDKTENGGAAGPEAVSAPAGEVGGRKASREYGPR